MKDEMFEELLESVREGGAILRREKAPARQFEIEAPDVKRLREEAGFSQREFATLMGISTGTLRNWEQGRRQPAGAARVLLTVATRHPQIVWGVVRSTGTIRSKAEQRRKQLSRMKRNRATG
jgi:putative transcriptional regulator